MINAGSRTVHVNVVLFQAYNFHGETLLAQDKCGEAIKCLEESVKSKIKQLRDTDMRYPACD